MNTVYEEHTTKITVSHLLYMDNLKLIGKSEEGPQKQMKIRTFSDDIHKECGLCKCAKIVLKKGVHSQNLILDFNTRAWTGKNIEVPRDWRKWRHNTSTNERLKKEYTRRLRMIVIYELNAENKIIATATLAIPVLIHSFGVINWRLEQVRKIDRKTKQILTMYKMHHPKADTDRLYVQRKGGGRGLLQIEAKYEADNQYCRIHEQKICRIPVFKHW